jgi:peroxiredoxin
MSQEFKSKGISSVICLSVNDFFVMKAWAAEHNALSSVSYICDGSGAFTKALGLEVDLSEAGLGIRAKRLPPSNSF